jgi:hypothetical protein
MSMTCSALPLLLGSTLFAAAGTNAPIAVSTNRTTTNRPVVTKTVALVISNGSYQVLTSKESIRRLQEDQRNSRFPRAAQAQAAEMDAQIMRQYQQNWEHYLSSPSPLPTPTFKPSTAQKNPREAVIRNPRRQSLPIYENRSAR